MTKIYVTVESSQGRVLGRSESSKERITIGRAPSSTLRLDDEKVAASECEIYILNGECWLQVSKEGSAVSFKGKQFRTLKIEESSVLYFKNLVLKVDFTKPLEIDAEKTRVLSGLEMAPMVKKEDVWLSAEVEVTKAELEITKADLDMSEKTRVVSVDMEKTRIVKPGIEATKIVTEDSEKTRVVPFTGRDEKPFEAHVSTSITEEDIYGRDDEPIPFNLKDYLDRKNINFKDLLVIALAMVVTIGVGKWLFFGPKGTPVSLDKIAQEQQIKLQLTDPQRQRPPPLNTFQADTVPAEVLPATREEYLRSLSSLFDKH